MPSNELITSINPNPALQCRSWTSEGAGTNAEAIYAYTDGDRNAILATNQSGGGYPTIFAENSAGSGTAFAVYAKADGTGAGPYTNVYALYATTAAQSGYGVFAESNGTAATGVYATVGGSGSTVGVLGTSSNGTGVLGRTSGSASAFGIVGSALANSTTAYAVYGITVYASAYAGYFNGNMNVANGNSTHSGSGSKTFRIDHPLDPENKFLLHACIESPELKTFYDGSGIAGDDGELTVQLPDYFEALNTNHRYQLTAIGEAAPALHVKQEVARGQFIVAGAMPGQKVCWQVSGTRHDPTSKVLPFTPELDKPDAQRGFYLCPEAHGQPKEKGVDALDEARLAETVAADAAAARTSAQLTPSVG